MESKKLLILPYVKDVSEKIERIAVPLGVKTVFRSGNTLRQTLVDVKNRTPHETKKGVVYEVPCADCGHVYIGETGWTLKKRLKEHDYAVRRGDPKNGTAVHAWENDHRVNWEAAKVRLVEQNLRRRKVLEAILIKRERLSSNLDCGLQLSTVWTPLLEQPRAPKPTNQLLLDSN